MAKVYYRLGYRGFVAPDTGFITVEGPGITKPMGWSIRSDSCKIGQIHAALRLAEKTIREKANG